MNFPPPAQEVLPVPISGQSIIETIYSPSGAERNFITRDSAGLFCVYEEHWNTFVDEPSDSYWCRNGPFHFTDDLATARRYALLGFSDSKPDEIT